MTTESTAAAKRALAEALKGRTADTRALLSVNIAELISGDAVDGAKITAWVNGNSKPKPADDIPARYRPQPEHGRDVGTEEAERRFGTNH